MLSSNGIRLRKPFKAITMGLMLSWATLASADLGPTPPDSEDLALNQLFQIHDRLPKEFLKGPNTFIVFVNGAADHYVPPSFPEIKQRWGKADAHDVAEIKSTIRACDNCNLLLLHIQRGGARWYTPKHPFATYLRGYSAGKKIFSKHVDRLNAANPKVLARLITTAQELFPNTNTHLIYRGHGFYPSYDPKTNANEIIPFDLNYKESPYGIDQFVEGLRGAKLNTPLGSITFAACSMSYLEIAEKVAPFAKYMLAPQVDVIETLKFGFDYDFLRLIPFYPPSDRAIPKVMADILMQRFQTHPQVLDNKMEQPLSLIRLEEIGSLKLRFWALLKQLHQNQDQFFKNQWPNILKQNHVSEVVSNRYVRSMIEKGKSQNEALEFAKKYQHPAHNPNELDVVTFLEWLSQNYFKASAENPPTPTDLQLKEELHQLEIQFKSAQTLEVFNAANHAHHFGLSFDASPIREGRIE